jgi:hypothetical protein
MTGEETAVRRLKDLGAHRRQFDKDWRAGEVAHWARVAKQHGTSPNSIAQALDLTVPEVYEILGAEDETREDYPLNVVELVLTDQEHARVLEAAREGGYEVQEFVRIAVLRRAREVNSFGQSSTAG